MKQLKNPKQDLLFKDSNNKKVWTILIYIFIYINNNFHTNVNNHHIY